MSGCTDGQRRMMSFDVTADLPAVYAFVTTPLADPLLTFTARDRAVDVGVELSADGETFVAGRGVGLNASGEWWWTIPRSAAAIRVTATGPVAVRLAILEAA